MLGTGNAGSVDVSVSGALALDYGGVISSSTLTAGTAGSVTVRASSLRVDGDAVSYTHLDVYKRQGLDEAGVHDQRVGDDGDVAAVAGQPKDRRGDLRVLQPE